MEEKGLIEVTNELEAELETVDLMKCFEEGFPDNKIGHATQLIKAINSYVSSQELRRGCQMKFLTNWIPNGKWKAGNDKYSFLVIFEEKELRRWDIGVKELTFLIPAMLKNKVSDLRGRVLKIKKEKDERDRVNYLIEFIPKKIK